MENPGGAMVTPHAGSVGGMGADPMTAPPSVGVICHCARTISGALPIIGKTPDAVPDMENVPDAAPVIVVIGVEAANISPMAPAMSGPKPRSEPW